MALTCRLLLSSVVKRVISRSFSKTCVAFGLGEKNQPLCANELARCAGIASMFRLPIQQDSEGLDACFIGVPFDGGTSHRSGARFGPRQIRCESVLVRAVNGVTGAAPYDSLMVADVGDIPVIPYNPLRTCQIIKEHMSKIIKNGCRPLAIGGDHLMTYPILQAMKEKHGKVGIVHIDAHPDTQDHQLGEKITHGTPLIRAIEEELIDCERVVQIGLRGTALTRDQYAVSEKKGFRMVQGEEFWHKSLTPLMVEVREQMGDNPVYITLDVDALDPSVAPGTGAPEMGGLTGIQSLEILRGCKGLNVVGGEVVEVCPPYDPYGATALLAANLLFEMLCILPGVQYE